ncbi:hypothetical protein [Georgenia thermotolerans]|uniref:hypothetical protein n=1 Tax=Georgenia thermotolerans TaxID=527326 RepID=UPI00186ACBBA|nr:hypothetical protein [Georgenia thermotolerans]
MTLALLAALVGTVGYGAGSVLQAAATSRASGPAALRHPLYLAGLGCDLVAWLASLVALRHLPLFAVQALLAGSLVVTAVLGRVFLDARLRRRDVAAIGVVTVALVAVAASAGEQAAHRPPSPFTAAVLGGLALCALALLALYPRGRSAALAVVAGAAFSGAALSARVVRVPAAGTPATRVVVDLLTDPLLWVIPVFGLLGLLAYARSLERGAVGPATAVMWTVEVVVPAVVGVALLGDGVRPGWAGVAVAAVLPAVAGCAVLALGPADAPHPATGPAHGVGLS